MTEGACVVCYWYAVPGYKGQRRRLSSLIVKHFSVPALVNGTLRARLPRLATTTTPPGFRCPKSRVLSFLDSYLSINVAVWSAVKADPFRPTAAQSKVASRWSKSDASFCLIQNPGGAKYHARRSDHPGLPTLYSTSH